MFRKSQSPKTNQKLCFLRLKHLMNFHDAQAYPLNQSNTPYDAKTALVSSTTHKQEGYDTQCLLLSLFSNIGI